MPELHNTGSGHAVLGLTTDEGAISPQKHIERLDVGPAPHAPSNELAAPTIPFQFAGARPAYDSRDQAQVQVLKSSELGVANALVEHDAVSVAAPRGTEVEPPCEKPVGPAGWAGIETAAITGTPEVKSINTTFVAIYV